MKKVGNYRNVFTEEKICREIIDKIIQCITEISIIK